MKKNKKIIGIILSITIVVSLLATVLIATANAKETSVNISVDKTELKTGESATVSVAVTTNYPVATMSIPVFYDKTLVDVSEPVATLDNYSVKNAIIDTQSADSGKIYANTGITDAKFGFVLVNYIGSAGAQVPENINSVVLSFTITAKENVSGTAAVKCVTKSQKTDSNVAGMMYFGTPVNGRTIDAIPENVETVNLTNAVQNIKITSVSSANTIKLKENAPYEAVIDKFNCGEYNGTIYGIDTLGLDDDGMADGTLADFLTTAYGDEYLEIVVGESGVETTGTLINVLDADGNVVETYVFVYFGDVDMDGYLTSNDGFLAEEYEFTYEGLDYSFQLMAIDVDGDGMVSSYDGSFPQEYEFTYEGMPQQSEIAQTAVNNNYEMV